MYAPPPLELSGSLRSAVFPSPETATEKPTPLSSELSLALLNVATGVVLEAHRSSLAAWKTYAPPAPPLYSGAPATRVVPSAETASPAPSEHAVADSQGCRRSGRGDPGVLGRDMEHVDRPGTEENASVQWRTDECCRSVCRQGNGSPEVGRCRAVFARQGCGRNAARRPGSGVCGVEDVGGPLAVPDAERSDERSRPVRRQRDRAAEVGVKPGRRRARLSPALRVERESQRPDPPECRPADRLAATPEEPSPDPGRNAAVTTTAIALATTNLRVAPFVDHLRVRRAVHRPPRLSCAFQHTFGRMPAAPAAGTPAHNNGEGGI